MTKSKKTRPASEKPQALKKLPASSAPPIAKKPPAASKPPVVGKSPVYGKPPVVSKPPVEGKPPVSKAPPVLNIDTHRGLAAAQKEIASRFQANPDIAKLLLVNPVCAFQDIGVKVSPDIASHILHTMRNSSETYARRQVLEDGLKKVAGEAPKPSDGAWVAEFLFRKLKLKPLDTARAKPVYKPTVDPALAAKQMASIPKLNTAPALPHPDHGTAFVFTAITPGVRNLDLDKAPPKLAEAKEAPQSVDLTALYFYKDADPRVHDLLELGIIETQSFQISTANTYRKIKSGELPNPWGDWVSNITFSPATK
jgi:hypothetical protein